MRDDHRKRVDSLRARKRGVLKKVTKACDASKRRTSADVKAMREKERERINKKAAAMRAKTQKQCDARRAKVRGAVDDAVRLADEERDERLRRARQLGAAERKRAKRLAAAERRQERREARQQSDDEVEANIDAELRPVWRKVKRDIEGTSKMSRTEAFLHWVDENEGDVWALRQDEIDAELDDLAAEQAAYYDQAG